MKNAKAAAEKAGLLMSVLNRLRLVIKLMGDQRVPGLVKMLPVAAVLYLLSPIDLIPDVAIGLGQLDDLGILILGVNSFIQMAPQHVVQELLAEIEGKAKGNSDIGGGSSGSGAHAGDETIDGSYRVKN